MVVSCFAGGGKSSKEKGPRHSRASCSLQAGDWLLDSEQFRQSMQFNHYINDRKGRYNEEEKRRLYTN
jgi:hypothetical protein